MHICVCINHILSSCILNTYGPYVEGPVCVYKRPFCVCVQNTNCPSVCVHKIHIAVVHTCRTRSFLGEGFGPRDPSFVNLYHYLEQNCAFGLVPEQATGPRSQVLPGSRVRNPQCSKKILVRHGKTHMAICIFPQ